MGCQKQAGWLVISIPIYLELIRLSMIGIDVVIMEFQPTYSVLNLSTYLACLPTYIGHTSLCSSVLNLHRYNLQFQDLLQHSRNVQ